MICPLPYIIYTYTHIYTHTDTLTCFRKRSAWGPSCGSASRMNCITSSTVQDEGSRLLNRETSRDPRYLSEPGASSETATVTPSIPTVSLQQLFTLKLPFSLLSQSNGRDNMKGTSQPCPRDSCGTVLAPKPYSLFRAAFYTEPFSLL